MEDAKEETKAVIDGTPKALGGVFVGSLMVMAKAAIQCDDHGSDYCEDYEGWALACAVIGVAISLAGIILLKVLPEFKGHVGWIVMVFVLAALWIAGVGTMTFKRPYKNTADNGYFGAWIATLSSLTLVTEALQSCNQSMKNKLKDGAAWDWWVILFAASTVAMIQSGIDCDEAADCEKELAWTVAASTVSTVVAIVMLILVCVLDVQTGPCVLKWISLVMVIWWICGVGVATYKKGPFLSLGNGYFAVWIALFASFQLFGILFFTEDAADADAEDAEQKVQEKLEEAQSGVTGYITALFLTSGATLIAAGIICDDINDLPGGDCKEYEAWAVAASAISVFFTLFMLVASFTKFLPTGIFDIMMIVVAAVLFAVWLVGTYTMTFQRPFKAERGNGYFGAWLSLILSWWWWTAVTPGLSGAMKKLEGFGGWPYQVLAIASLIEGLQAAHDCHEQDCGENHLGWAVACGWISLTGVILVFILIAVECWSRLGAIIAAIFFACWWTAGAIVLTYDKPYLSFGNAYAGTWIATICSWMILLDVLLYDGAETDTGAQDVDNEPAGETPAEDDLPAEDGLRTGE